MWDVTLPPPLFLLIYLINQEEESLMMAAHNGQWEEKWEEKPSSTEYLEQWSMSLPCDMVVSRILVPGQAPYQLFYP